MAATRTPAPEKVLKGFLEPFAKLERSEAAWVAGLRREAWERLRQLGVPSTDHEDWRFTPLAPVYRQPFALAPAGASVPAELLQSLTFADLSGPRLVFVDGHHAPGLSRAVDLPDGVRITHLAQTMAGDGASLEPLFARQARDEGNPFSVLNAAYFTDGGWVEVDAGCALDQPLHLLFITTGAGASTQVRNVVRAGRGSRLQVVESYVTVGAAPAFTNAFTDVVAEAGAQVEHVRFQDENLATAHLGAIQGEFGAASNVRLHSFALGARLFRNSLRTRLAGAGLECILNGLYLTRGEQLADHHMVVEHLEPHCASHEYFNGILDDRSRGVFHGRILVHPVAQKTDAKQTNKNILLSDDAQVNTKPQLEIYADDVKCTHGATIGQLDEDAIFYLRARGIGLDRAKRMLIHSFAGEIIERVLCDPVREQLDRLVWDRLERNLTVAEPGT